MLRMANLDGHREILVGATAVPLDEGRQAHIALWAPVMVDDGIFVERFSRAGCAEVDAFSALVAVGWLFIVHPQAISPSRLCGPPDGWLSPVRRCGSASDAAHQQEDDQDHDNEAKTAARGIAPVPAVAPRGERTDQDQDQDNQQNGAEAHDGALLCG